MLAELADLLFAARCCACGCPGRALCGDCRAELLAPVGSPDPVAVPGLVVPVWAAAGYEGRLRAAVVAWKEQGRQVIGRDLAWLLAGAVIGACAGERPLLVPVPASRRSLRRRGVDLTAQLAESASRRLAESGTPAGVERLLVLRRQPRDQAGLSAAERAHNLRDAMSAAAASGGSGPVVVVDDVCTTGSTLAEAVRALMAAGHRVVGCAVVARTPAPGAAACGQSGARAGF